MKEAMTQFLIQRKENTSSKLHLLDTTSRASPAVPGFSCPWRP
jgi:hypothetical protein